jgi:2-polyprenyl-3-methyl-5-hydroxy-6-metoxy-1,4-benzoquinol methylase
VTIITKDILSNPQFAVMNRTFWDTRYAENDIVYGHQPNKFFKDFIDSHKPGTILLPAEGEGRNAVYAAGKGWEVDAFDFSEEAFKKASFLSGIKNIQINYWLQEIESFTSTKKYDAVGLIYVHLPKNIRQEFHRQVHNSIRSGGFLIFEAFAKEQIEFNSGGPKDISLLYDAPTVCNDFPFLHVLFCGQREVELNEGYLHKGNAAVLQLIGQKL